MTADHPRWQRYRFLGADLQIRKLYQRFQIFECICYFAAFFVAGFGIQFIWLGEFTTMGFLRHLCVEQKLALPPMPPCCCLPTDADDQYFSLRIRNISSRGSCSLCFLCF
jgi:hypothetical protein